MNDHRLSRILGYDGIRAKNHSRAGGRATDAAAPPGLESRLLGHDGQAAPEKEGMISKAIRRAKEVVVGKPKKDLPENKRKKQIEEQERGAESPDNPRPEPKKLGSDARPENPAPRARGRGMPTPTPGGTTGRSRVIPPGAPPGLPVPGGPGKPAPIGRTPPFQGPSGPSPTPRQRAPRPPGGGASNPGAWGPLGSDGYTLKNQITHEGDAFDGKCLGTDGKVGKVMHEFKHGELHSGSKKGPKVKNRKQAIAIAMSESRKAGEKP
jgi:hypothetical protein